MAVLVYLLCAVTSLICALLLYRSYRESRSSLSYWTAVAFILLMLNNIFMVCDFVVFPDIDFYIPKTVPLVAGVLAMLYGLVCETTA